MAGILRLRRLITPFAKGFSSIASRPLSKPNDIFRASLPQRRHQATYERHVPPLPGEIIKCRAAIAWAPKEPLTIETVEVAPPEEKEVRVKMTSSGICHSDVHFLQGCDPHYPFPCVLGHEGAGIVESVGKKVKGLFPGDLVVPLFQGYCGECDYCKSPKTNLCRRELQNEHQRHHRITCNGEHLTQFLGVSTFSEYTVVPDYKIVKIDPGVYASRICLIGCCIPTGYGAAVQCAKVEPDSNCAIWGLGGVGLNVVMGCRDSNAKKIIGIDTNPKKLPTALEFGCTDVVNPKFLDTDLMRHLNDITEGAGIDYCFVSVGDIKAMEEAFSCSHPAWGQTIIIGLTDFGDKMKVGVYDLLYGRQLKGTFCGSYKTKMGLPILVHKVINGQIDLEKLISHVLPLDDINFGINALLEGESLRAVIDFEFKGSHLMDE